MANDRIFIRCPVCKAQKLLYKFYPSGGYTWNPFDADILPSRQNGGDFMDEHIHDCGERFDGDLHGDPFFELVTESRAVEKKSA